jgi:uncharacterized membrane protein SpoIIM required for sporulation
MLANKSYEERMEAHAISTRNAVRFIAWVIGIWVVISVIAGIVIAVEISHAANNVNNDISNCQSLGGTDPSC